MKITIFNLDGTIKEVQEHHFQIPAYITAFDPNQSFLNISDDEMAVFDLDDLGEQEFVVEKFRMLIEYDIANYKKYLLNDKKETSLINALLSANMEAKDVLKYSKLLGRFVRNIYSSHGHFSSKVSDDEESNFLNINIIVDVLVHNVYEAISNKGDSFDPNKFFFNQLNWLYYALKRCLKNNSLSSTGCDALNILWPFANLKNSGKEWLTTTEGVKRIQDALYSTAGKYRSELYRLLLVVNHLDETIKPMTSDTTYAFERIGNKIKTIIDRIPADVVENVRLQLKEDEIIALNIDCQVNEEIKKSIREVYNNQYNAYVESQGFFLKRHIIQQALRYFKFIEEEQLVRNDWRRLYFESLDDLANKYSGIGRSHYKLDIPLFYYYIIVEECEIGKKYDFDGQLLNDLIIRAIYRGSEEKSSLYEQMYRLNYMEMSANLIYDDSKNNDIKKEGNADNDKEELQNLYNRLLEGPNSNIAEDLRKGSFKLATPSEAIDYLIVWLEPLFKRHLNKTNEDQFKDLLIELLNDDLFKNKLLVGNKRKVIKHNLNVKLMLNIIGKLSELNKGNSRNWVKRYVGPKLRDDLTYMWKLKGSSSLHKYVSGWDNDIDFGVSELSLEMKNKIEGIFKQ